MNTGDGYESCPERYYQYIRKNELLMHDWIVFVDDDTFMFPKRFQAYLKGFDYSKSLYIGRTLTFPLQFMSGGAGFALSKAAYAELRKYLLSTPKEDVEFHENGDVTMGIWIEKGCKAEYIHCEYLNGSPHTYVDSCGMSEAFSYHYVTEELFRVYGGLI